MDDIYVLKKRHIHSKDIPKDAKHVKIQWAKVIGDYCFQEMDIKSIELPEGLEHIGCRAFQGSSIENIIIPNSVRNIEDRAFVYCDDLKNITILGDNLKNISLMLCTLHNRDIHINIGYGNKFIDMLDIDYKTLINSAKALKLFPYSQDLFSNIIKLSVDIYQPIFLDYTPSFRIYESFIFRFANQFLELFTACKDVEKTALILDIINNYKPSNKSIETIINDDFNL